MGQSVDRVGKRRLLTGADVVKLGVRVEVTVTTELYVAIPWH